MNCNQITFHKELFEFLDANLLFLDLKVYLASKAFLNPFSGLQDTEYEPSLYL